LCPGDIVSGGRNSLAYHASGRSRSLADQAAEQIRVRIANGDFQLGEALSETTLAAELGVSKTPIREALLRLKAEGLVDIQPQRGTFVFRMGTEEVRALSECRDVLECAALAMAMREDAPALGAALADIVSDMDQALARGDAATYRELDSRFHECIIRHCGNSYLSEAYGMIAFRIQTLRNLLSLDFELNARSLKQHALLSEVIAGGNTQEAIALLKRHIAGTRQEYAAKNPQERDAPKRYAKRAR
jgi:DNA-binding GntR family transcriptional regulator